MSDQPSEASRPPEQSPQADPQQQPEPQPPAPTAAAAPDPSVKAATPDQLVKAAAAADAPSRAGTPAAGAGNPWQYGAGAPGARNSTGDGVTARLRPPAPPLIRPAVLWTVLATAVLSALLLGDGLGVNLLIVAVLAALAAFFAARSAGRRLRPWTATWAVGGLALLAVPALRDAGWPTFLAVVSAFALGSLALHGSRSWLGVLIGSLGLFDSVVPGIIWGVRGIRARADGSRARWGAGLRTTAVAAVLLVVFGTLFASADAAFADLLGSLIPDVSLGDGPWRIFLFALGLAGALAAAYAAAAPVRWDGITVSPGKPRGRVEWALP